MAIVWLASYPKSGNTWARAVLTNYLRPAATPASINALVGKPIADDREHFDNYLGLGSSDMAASAIDRNRPRFQEVLADALPSPWFIKTHCAWRRVGDGEEACALFSPDATVGVVHLVRNPLDVAVSLAHHHRFGIDDAIRRMNDPAAAEANPKDSAIVLLPQRLSTWSGHAASWTEQSELRVHLARYEDLLADPVAGFGAIVRFAALPWDAERLARSVENAEFERLRAQEERVGFAEKHPPALSFFRAGRAGAWREVLSPAQVEALVAAHGTAMRQFGYLDEARAFLRHSAPLGEGRQPRLRVAAAPRALALRQADV